MGNFDKRHIDKTQSLYFIALLPDAETSSEIVEIKGAFSDKYGPKQALKSPPHITLHMPFLWKEAKLSVLRDCLYSFSESIKQFSYTINGFGAFPPRVIYLNIDLNTQLEALQKNLVNVARKSLKLDNADYKNRGFHPHITIAYRDLKKPVFLKAWPQYQLQPFTREITARQLTLLQHDGQMWTIFDQFDFRA